MSGDPVVREATQADAPELARLSTELGYPATNDEMAERLAAALASDDHTVFVVDAAGGRLAGWLTVQCRLVLETGSFAEIVGLVVSAGARRGGVGRALVAAAECWAADRGLGVICARSNAARDAAHPFYRGVGFRHVKTQHVYRKRIGGS